MITLPLPTTPPEFLPAAQTFYGDVLFNRDSDQDYLLDYYVPQGVAPENGWPWVLAIHGGSFISGDKDFLNASVYDDLINDLLENRGVAVVSMQYRLLDEGFDSKGIPRSIVSAFRNILRIKQNAATLNLDRDRVVYFGSSAGGFISQFFSMQEFAGKDGTGLFSISSLPVAALSFKPNVTMDLFQIRNLDLWAEGVTINDILSENSLFADNCKRWYGITGSVLTENDLKSTTSLNIMRSVCPLQRKMYTPQNLPLYMVTQNEYALPSFEIESLIHNPFNPETIKAIYDNNQVECWTLGVNASSANGNPVPSTPGVPDPAFWITEKLAQ